MRYSLRIEVRLKPGHSDPEGETTASLLRQLGYRVETVNISKIYRVALEAKSLKDAENKADQMCKRLLANPTKDSYRIAVEEQE